MKREIVFGSFENKYYPRCIFKKCKETGYHVTLFSGHKFDPQYFNDLIDITQFLDPNFSSESYLSKIGLIGLPIQRSVLSWFDEAQIYFNRIFDRVSFSLVSFRARERLFIELLTTFITVMERKKNDTVVIWRETPHSPACILFFFVCKFLDIPFYFPLKTQVDSRVMFVDDFRVGHINIIKFANIENLFSGDLKSIGQSETVNNHFLKRAKLINKERGDLAKSRVKQVKRKLRAIQRLSSAVITGDIQSRNALYRLSRVQLFKQIIVLNKRAKLYEKKLAQKSVSDIPQSGFIFYPLNFQPEMSTDPCAGFFTHPHVLLRQILAATGDHEKVVVKEHPRQFLSYENLPEINFRDAQFLDLITNSDRVVILSREIPNEEIIRRASLVIGSTGSSLWEANTMGIPSLSFAPTWHMECRSSPMYKEEGQPLESVVASLREMDSLEIKICVDSFLKNSEELLLNTVNMHRAAVASKIPFDMLVDNFFECIVALATQKFSKV